MLPVTHITPYTSLVAFVIGLPTALATYYQAWKTRQESRNVRRGYVYSRNCLEFVLIDGTSVNLVPLETLHSLPKPGDIVLLPGADDEITQLPPSAYRIGRVEHIYARVGTVRAQARQARLVKAVAYVESLVESSLHAGSTREAERACGHPTECGVRQRPAVYFAASAICCWYSSYGPLWSVI